MSSERNRKYMEKILELVQESQRQHHYGPWNVVVATGVSSRVYGETQVFGGKDDGAIVPLTFAGRIKMFFIGKDIKEVIERPVLAENEIILVNLDGLLPPIHGFVEDL